ncbi:MAG TPA: NAD(P)/FAD-dependent oxidoreductase [Kofleriaceae bacterium]|nr:NAD(P)/FAD-dependent oxidoreductase [Kofleriaceae bacterium]
MRASHVDVLIVGAGLSGIGAAHHLQERCPQKTYLILEGRERLGGTWDLFRYPGIRSDSDMYTLGYSFRPWTSPQAIADGDSILAYIRETAEAAGIDRNIRYQHRVERARWSTSDARWTIEARDTATGEPATFTCGFLYVCAGYYDYAAGYTPPLPGRERFAGRVVHPQHWTPDIDYDGKRVVVIGSGATAVTLVPELAKRAAHVTMLQRSPTYITSRPRRDAVADWLRAHLPARAAYAVTRWKNVLLGMGFYEYCRRAPERAKRLLVELVRRELRGAADLAHFTPSYRPWDQRLCLVPDGDLFESIREGRASVVTDRIETFTETGIALGSGAHLPADLIVTATGLQLVFFGGIALEVDGAPVEPSRLLVYKGMMCSDVPNCAFASGYTNASWTLKADLTSAYVCRLLNYMDAHGYVRCCPRRLDPDIEERPLLDFSSGYVQRVIDQLPKQGSVAPWRLYQNYAIDRLLLERARVDDPAMEFARPSARPTTAVAGARR